MLIRLAYLAALLMCFSRSFAKIGFGGVYITELTVLLLIPFIVFQKQSKRGSWELLLGFMILYHFIAVLMFDIARYQIGEIVRDSIIWLYPMTALYVAYQKEIDIDKIFKVFQKVITVWLFIYPVLFSLIYLGGPDLLNTLPIKKSDTTTAFSLFILISFHFGKIHPASLLFLIVDIFFVSTQGRSSLMIIFFTIIAGMILNRDVIKTIRIPRKYVVVGLLLIAGASLINLPATQGHGRSINFNQILENAVSIVGESDSKANLEGTEIFRLLWWAEIVRESIVEKFTFYGHGYGLNLADYYGFQVGVNGSLRSPHNFVMTLLARSGWFVTIFTCVFMGIMMLRGLLLKSLYASIGIILAMMFINAFFDVYLEGPMGAFPFWFFVGLILSKINDNKEKMQSLQKG